MDVLNKENESLSQLAIIWYLKQENWDLILYCILVITAVEKCESRIHCNFVIKKETLFFFVCMCLDKPFVHFVQSQIHFIGLKHGFRPGLKKTTLVACIKTNIKLTNWCFIWLDFMVKLHLDNCLKSCHGIIFPPSAPIIIHLYLLIQ